MNIFDLVLKLLGGCLQAHKYKAAFNFKCTKSPGLSVP